VLSVVGIGIAASVPLWATNETAFVLTAVLGFALVGLSIGFLTGLNGQLALGQFAIAAFGAWAAWYVSSRTNSFEFGMLTSAAMGASVSVLIGLPALRVRGLLLAVTTLAFALAAEGWILQQPWMFGEGVDPGKPIIGTTPLDTALQYYGFALLVFVIAAWVMRNMRTSGIALRLVALRDNEDAARAFTIDLRRDTMRAYALAGAFAGIGGAVYGHSLSSLSVPFFLAAESINVVAMTVIGGLGLLIGPLVGALYVVAIPRLVDLDMAGRALHTLLILIVLVASPGGLAGLVAPMRERVTAWAARRAGVSLDAEAAIAPPTVEAGGHRARQQRPPSRVSRHVRPARGRVHQRQGGRHAAAGGVGRQQALRRGDRRQRDEHGRASRPDRGAGGPERRRQDHLLRDHLRLRHPRRGPGRLRRAGHHRRRSRGTGGARPGPVLPGGGPVPDPVGAGHGGAGPRTAAAISPGRRHDGSEQGTPRDPRPCPRPAPPDGAGRLPRQAGRGTVHRHPAHRRAHLHAGAGTSPAPAGRTGRRCGPAGDRGAGWLLERIKEQLGTTMVVIEHDIPLLASICDHMIAMESGRLLAEGTPEEVQASDAVIDAFLGGDLRAVQRSGTPVPTPTEPSTAEAPA
jgi:ABC-type branched-subunit amino acid transport system permease subunit